MPKENEDLERLIETRFFSTFKQNPVVDSTVGKYSFVSLIHYTKKLLRVQEKITPLGYCVECPREVLEECFGDYHVTFYNGYELFSSQDFEPLMLGLGINRVEPQNVYGIEYNGKLRELLQLDELNSVRRSKRISGNDILKIVSHLTKGEGNGFLNPNYSQEKHDRQEIIDIVKGFE